jgi:hypothetical protein
VKLKKKNSMKDIEREKEGNQRNRIQRKSEKLKKKNREKEKHM